jgi:hypothetical protein
VLALEQVDATLVVGLAWLAVHPHAQVASWCAALRARDETNGRAARHPAHMAEAFVARHLVSTERLAVVVIDRSHFSPCCCSSNR